MYFPINNQIKAAKIPDSRNGNGNEQSDCVLAFRAFCQILSLCVIISFQNKPNKTSASGENCILNQSACSDNFLTEILINTKDNSSGHNSDDVVADNEHVNDNVFQKTPQPYVLKILKDLSQKSLL